MTSNVFLTMNFNANHKKKKFFATSARIKKTAEKIQSFLGLKYLKYSFHVKPSMQRDRGLKTQNNIHNTFKEYSIHQF